jgi:hypothetical protein
MCDCEELEFEDFEVMLTALSKKSPAPAMEATLQAPVPQEVAVRQRK